MKPFQSGGAIKHINWTSGITENNITFGQFLLTFSYNGTTYTDVEICGYRFGYYVSWATPPVYRYAYVGQVLGGSQLQGTVIFHDTWSGQVTIIGNSFPVAHNVMTLFSELTTTSGSYTGSYYRFGPCLVVVKINNYYDSKWLSNPSDLNCYIDFKSDDAHDYLIYFNNAGAYDAHNLPVGSVIKVYTIG